MADFVVTKRQISAGIWEGLVDFRGAGDPRNPVLDCLAAGERIDGVSFIADGDGGDRWIMRIAIPSHLISDGVQVFQIVDRETGEDLHHFTILTDESFDDGTREEIALLRAEMDILKQTVRRLSLEP